ncbi:MAG: AAA family ATPase, partial [Planctomycetes bacterium]|nr:AAA family ATPase [Planctomycetota bacterium]
MKGQKRKTRAKRRRGSTMKLEAVHLVQFFAYERFTLSPGESTGIFGANGSGKSSFLDAVQIAMFGANSNLTALNAQADESTKSSRSIRGYCLGQFGENPEDRIRQRANTYITLVWRDPSSNRPVSMGVAIEASGDSEKHNVLGRYLADGVELTLGDHMTSRDGQESPRDWRTFRADLARRVESVCGHAEDLFFDSSEKFIKAFLLLMSAGKDAGSVALFKRAFRFAMRLRFDKSVDSIIRDEVLESRPTNIKAFRELTETFRRLRVMVEDVERRIREGAEIEKLFIEADKLERRAGAWQVLAADVHGEHAMDEANAAQG